MTASIFANALPAGAYIPKGMSTTPRMPPPVVRPVTVSHAVGVCSGYGQHHTANRAAKYPKPYTALSMANIVEMMRNPPSVDKAAAQWAIFTDYTGENARDAAYLRATGAKYYALWADIDKAAGVAAQEILSIASVAAAGGAKTHLYTSRSATEQNQKAHILAPLAEPVDAVTFEIMQQVFNNRLEAAGLVPDDKTETCNQLCYLPNRGAFYWSGEQGTQALNPQSMAKEVEAIRAAMIAEDEARAARMAANAARYAELIAKQGATPIQATKEAYGDPRDLLIHYGGIAKGNRVISPNSESGSAGVTFKDDKWYSSHGSDVAAGMGQQSNNGRSCWGDSFDLVCFFEYGNDRTAAVRAMAERFQPTENKQRRINHRREQDEAKALEAFSPAGGGVEPVAPAVPHELNKWHSLTREVDLSATVTPPRWILPNFIAEGIALIAGGHGVGKTTTLLPLAMAAAGIHEDGYPLAPKHWRHVVYITEDVGQAKLIINGWMNHAGLDYDHLKERVHIVEASRMPPEQVVQIGQWYAQKYTRTVTTATVGDVDVLPLVVIDTMAATFELENENDNAEASRMIALLKQHFCNLPVWIVGHVSKGDLSRDGAKSGTPTLRGASAFEADANQVLYLVNDDGNRWLVRGKSRFESPWFELMIETDSRTVTALNAFGDQETLIQRWGIARPSIKTRTEMAKDQQAAEQQRADDDKKKALIDYAKQAEDKGAPLSKTELKTLIGGNGQKAIDLIDALLDEGWLFEATVPVEQRTHHKRSHYIVSLGFGERDEYLAKGKPPAHKLEVPDTWKKAIKEKTPI